MPDVGNGRIGRVAFLTRSGRRARLKGGGPKEFIYGFAELSARSRDVELIEENDIGLSEEWPRPIEALANRVSAVAGFHPRTLVALYRHRDWLSRFSHVVATNHSLGLACAFLHRLDPMRPRPLLLTMGLIEANPSQARVHWLRWLLKHALLATLSRAEGEVLRRTLGPSVAVEDFVFGVDLDFWRPSEAAVPGDYVLSVGNDPKRDFDTLVEAWRPDFPLLRILTSRDVRNAKPNVRVERGDWRTQAVTDADLRDQLQRALLVVVPVRETLQPSGQSACLQAMACGRPVVMTANCGLWDRPQIERHRACRLVPPGNAAALAGAVSELLADRREAEALGRRAREMVVTEDVSSRSMAGQIARLAGLQVQ